MVTQKIIVELPLTWRRSGRVDPRYGGRLCLFKCLRAASSGISWSPPWSQSSRQPWPGSCRCRSPPRRIHPRLPGMVGLLIAIQHLILEGLGVDPLRFPDLVHKALWLRYTGHKAMCLSNTSHKALPWLLQGNNPLQPHYK